jgi:MFS family permease
VSPARTGPARAERAVIATVALGTILAPLNSTMIAVALPRIIDDFGSSVRAGGWLVTSYLIALAATQPIAGRLGDAVGRRPLMLIGLVVFGLVSVGAALAPTLPALVAFRIGQAVSGALVFPNGVGLLRAVVPAGRRARAFGALGAVLSSSAAIGPIVGGLALTAGGWRAMFLVNLPIVLAALVLTWRVVPAGRSRGDGSLFGLGVLRNRRFTAAAGSIAFGNLAFYSMLVASPVLLVHRRGWSSAEVGLALAALSAPAALLAPVGGRLADRFGRRAPAFGGGCLLALAAVAPAVDPGLPPAAFVVCLALIGSGVGLATAALQTSAVESVPPADAGTAAGMFSTSRYLGSIVGTILLGALLSKTGAGAGYRDVFVMVLAAAALSALVSLGLSGSKTRHLVEPAGADGVPA